MGDVEEPDVEGAWEAHSKRGGVEIDIHPPSRAMAGCCDRWALGDVDVEGGEGGLVVVGGRERESGARWHGQGRVTVTVTCHGRLYFEEFAKSESVRLG